ncbi:hypothetical protein BDN71DRAFT_1510009 [Pleurotus eryngii]|uniref:Uncharacterized protein n=1 Tax=Pleurotus eryngii TaxID=5323 RepID=A0A9P5ZP46_PLEER|nr:hypothetical protein BDN71DRAFT_1510009 [Pleurotus eryngii]
MGATSTYLPNSHPTLDNNLPTCYNTTPSSSIQLLPSLHPRCQSSALDGIVLFHLHSTPATSSSSIRIWFNFSSPSSLRVLSSLSSLHPLLLLIFRLVFHLILAPAPNLAPLPLSCLSQIERLAWHRCPHRALVGVILRHRLSYTSSGRPVPPRPHLEHALTTLQHPQSLETCPTPQTRLKPTPWQISSRRRRDSLRM